MDGVAWGALTLSLTLVGAVYTYYAFRRRGLAPALRGAGLTLLPLAAYLTDTLRMFTRIVDAVADWATRLVFSPVVWVGVVVAGIAVLLLGAARVVERRTGPAEVTGARNRGPAGSVSGRTDPAPGPRAGSAPAAPVDDEMAEIEAILRKRGIS